MKHTYMYDQGYRFYVYVRPGVMEYFFTYGPAKDYADAMGVEVKDLDF